MSHVLAAAYAKGAEAAGHEVKPVALARLEFPLLKTQQEWRGDMPALVKGFLAFCGVSPVRTTLIGMVEGGGAGSWLERMSALGRAAR
ncbi:MAG TPA: hypothetical protein VML57_08825 [Burkholderiales bacterium]|nr:hypothetical protein [Burkholderiales bacterium]